MGNQTNSLPKLSHSTFWLFSYSVVIQPPSHVQLFATPWTATCHGSLSYTVSQSFLKLMSIELMMPPTISSSVFLFSSCLQSFPASGSFQMSQFFTSGGQSIAVSASSSVLPVNGQGWFALGLTGLISLHSKGLSRVFSSGDSLGLNRSVMSYSLQPHGLQPARLLCSWGFSRQEYWSGLPCPPPGDLPNPEIEPKSPTLQANSLPSEPPQHHNSKASILWRSAFFMAQLSHPYMTTGKSILSTIWTFISKVMSLLFNRVLSRFIIASLPRSKRLLISWLQSLSTVILEPKKVKCATFFTFFPSICR